jgi:hypothetical protein
VVDLPDDVARLLESERNRPPPPADARARLLDGVLGTIGATPVAAGGAPGVHPGKQVARAGLRALMTKPLAIAAIGFAAGASGGVAVGRAIAPREVRVVYVDRFLPGPSASAPASESAVPEAGVPVAPPSAPPLHAPVASVPAAPATTGRDRELAAERSRIEIARTSLMQGDPAAALRSLDQHAAHYPTGQLSEEREALAVQALVALGRVDEARGHAAAFTKRYPTSMLSPVVQAAVAPPK